MPGTLYLVATPIGNLEDLSSRAERTLRECDLVLAEDTRTTRTLFKRFGVTTALSSFHEFSDPRRVQEVITRLADGADIALVTDAGTPGISDPGAHLVTEAVRRLGEEVRIVPIPGPCAATSALSASGFPAQRFVFLGFLPPKKGRADALGKATGSIETTVLYESPHRIHRTLKDLAARAPDREAVVCRELTKTHESIYRGTLTALSQTAIPAKGEFVIVLGPEK